MLQTGQLPPRDTWESSGNRDRLLSPKAKRSSSPWWLLALRCLSDWPQGEHLVSRRRTRTLSQPPPPPRSALLGAGSGNFLSITWDLLFPVSAAVPSHPDKGRTAPREASQAATRPAVCVPGLARPRWRPHSCLMAGSQGGTAAPHPSTEESPLSCPLSWTGGGGNSRPGVW